MRNFLNIIYRFDAIKLRSFFSSALLLMDLNWRSDEQMNSNLIFSLFYFHSFSSSVFFPSCLFIFIFSLKISCCMKFLCFSHGSEGIEMLMMMSAKNNFQGIIFKDHFSQGKSTLSSPVQQKTGLTLTHTRTRGFTHTHARLYTHTRKVLYTHAREASHTRTRGLTHTHTRAREVLYILMKTYRTYENLKCFPLALFLFVSEFSQFFS